MTAPAGRPWWKKKRWAAALMFWLVVAYPLGLGPVFYLFGRGSVSGEATAAYFRPYEYVRPVRSPTALDSRYIDWAVETGIRHRRPPSD